ncbi:MAG: succinylglutamate desuccinylase/aspartoacylase family protein [Halobacteriales archaeon]
MELGTATARPGELARGYLDVAELPTGGTERLPVIIAEGDTDGPELWITAAIHGNEVTGLAAAQDVMTEDLPSGLTGTVVCLPNLNPAGLRRNARTSYYHDDDPNRYFPEPEQDPKNRSRPPNLQEVIDERIFDLFADSADCLISLHTAGVNSEPFNIRDRVRYGEHRTKEEAEELAAELDRLVEAFGIPVVNQYDPNEQDDQSLTRSIATAALDTGGIPAFTPELGAHDIVEESNRAAAVMGIRNVMRALGMLDGSIQPNEAAADQPVEFPVKRATGPHTDTPGIARHRVQEGDTFETSDPIADIVTPTGEHKTTVEAEHDGYVIARNHGIAVYKNDALARLAVRDENDLVVSRDPDDG